METTISPKLMNNLYKTIREQAEWQRIERRLNSHRPRTLEEIKRKWEDNARLHATWILSPRFQDTYSRLYVQTLRTLESLNANPESPIYGHGEEIFEAYVAVLNERIGNKREVLSPLPRFGEQP